MPVPRLPEELIEEIIALLKGNFVALRACSLASRTFRAISQPLIFQNLIVIAGTIFPEDRKPDTLTAQRFRKILENRPKIGILVQSLHLYEANTGNGNPDGSLNETTFAACLPHLRKLRFLSIHIPQTHGLKVIRKYSTSFKKALLKIIKLPSLTSLNVWSMPLVVLKGKKRLQHISIGGLGGMHSVIDSLVRPGDRCMIESMQLKFDAQRFVGRGNSITLKKLLDHIVDLTNLRHLSLICCNVVEYQPAAALVLELCRKKLRRLVIDPRYPVNDTEGISSLVLAGLVALQELHVRLNIPHLPQSIPKLIVLLDSLPPAHLNRLRELTVHVNQGAYDHEADFPSWLDLFNLVTNVDRFPHLLKFTMKVFSYDGLDQEVMEDWENMFTAPNRPKLCIEIKFLDEASAFEDLFPFWPYPEWDRVLPLRKEFVVR